MQDLLFQSTPPVKAATNTDKKERLVSDISIHAAREGGDRDCKGVGKIYKISIHAAREGGDGFRLCCKCLQFHFNPRRP